MIEFWPQNAIFPGDLPFPEEAGEKPIIHKCSELDYHRIRAFSNTYLKNLVSATPLHALIKPKSQDAFTMGSLFECLVEDAFTTQDKNILRQKIAGNNFHTSAAKFNERCALRGDFSKGDGIRKFAEEWKEKNKDKVWVTLHQLMTAMEMLKSTLQNEGWSRHLRGGDWQVVVCWMERGLPMKAMLDFVYTSFDRKVPVDLKSCNGVQHKADAQSFGRQAGKYQYDMQAAHYMSGLAQVFGGDAVEPFVFLVCETSAPYGTAVYKCSEAFLESGFAQRNRALDYLLDYLDHYGDGPLPQYAKYNEEDIILEPPHYHWRNATNNGDAI